MTAIGAALLGGLGVRLWPDFATAVSGLELSTRIIRPNPQWQAVYGDLYGSVYRGFHRTLAGTNRGLDGIPHGGLAPFRFSSNRGNALSNVPVMGDCDLAAEFSGPPERIDMADYF
ncbi:hypothetical protein [Rhizobium sp. SYY.PMSO]|uniref:hypothetical protein n=1 Tax=Rhizobium sp. SYY.PMSO TaxID=3382192 RepID=UPI00398FC893